MLGGLETCRKPLAVVNTTGGVRLARNNARRVNGSQVENATASSQIPIQTTSKPTTKPVRRCTWATGTTNKVLTRAPRPEAANNQPNTCAWPCSTSVATDGR